MCISHSFSRGKAMKKLILLGVIVLFLGSTIPSGISHTLPGKHIITVDDEPGDGDFTSIKEAVNSSQSGDTIEVYSGTYPEQDILIGTANTTLLGVAHELGGGNDSGQPLIQGSKTGSILQVEASNVTVSNLHIVHSGAFFSHCIDVKGYDNVTIVGCCVRSSKNESNFGITVGFCNDTRIIDNDVSNCYIGIWIVSTLRPESVTVTGNVVSDCSPNISNLKCGDGILLDGDQQNISGNVIRRCNLGIDIRGTKNILYKNDFDGCPICVYSPGFLDSMRGNTIYHNNFKNYSLPHWWNFKDYYSRGLWWDRYIRWFPGDGVLFEKSDSWRENYWDTWSGIGPQKILGMFGFGLGGAEGGIAVILPWFEYDRHPAREPYEISEFR